MAFGSCFPAAAPARESAGDSRESWKDPVTSTSHIAPCLSISLRTSIPILFAFFALFPPGSISSRMLLSQRGLKGPVLVFLLNRRGRVSGSGSSFTKYMYEVLWSSKHRPWSGSNLQAAPRRCGTDRLSQWWHAACGCR
ncbi:hypothetical protein J3E68DRAFT_395443 [Trichoderma sp. SZMC 28012]